MAHIGCRDQHALFTGQADDTADIVKSFDLFVNTADRLHFAPLIDRTGDRDVLAQRDVRQAREQRIKLRRGCAVAFHAAVRLLEAQAGGERQRLGIAQAEVNYPDPLILDEPAASLDPQGRRDVLEVMSRLRKYATIFYCTHILDDAQRVSDQVAIVNQGQLITQTSIEELLAGTGDVIYSVTLRGDAQSAYAQINQQPWVSGIEASQEGEETTWLVSVTDEAAAKDQLLSLLVSSGLKVSNFSRKEQTLEDVFIKIIERPAIRSQEVEP